MGIRHRPLGGLIVRRLDSGTGLLDTVLSIPILAAGFDRRVRTSHAILKRSYYSRRSGGKLRLPESSEPAVALAYPDALLCWPRGGRMGLEARMQLMSRLSNLAERVCWLAPLIGGHLAALRFWIGTRGNPALRAEARYHELPFSFRGLDAMALREVLVDAEYAFAAPRLQAVPHPVILDVGAHIGSFAIWLAARYPRARILSVEADPDTFAVLEQNVAGLASRGITWQAVHAAAWHEGGDGLAFSRSGPSMSHRVSEHGDIVVPGITLAELMARLAGDSGTVDLMKVDIEGSEEAFLCAEPVLLKRVRCLIVELHPNLCDAPRVRALLDGIYRHIEEMQSRTSSKPLLLCY